MTDGSRQLKREVIILGLQDLSKRWGRIGAYLNPTRSSSYGRRWYDLVPDLFCLLVDGLLLPEFFLICQLLFKKDIRKLTAEEYVLAEEVFSNQIDLRRVMVDAEASFLVKKFSFAYVSFNMINYHKNLQDSIFVHELVHVMQYQKFGAMYIYRALKAQASEAGYDYGGIATLMDARSELVPLWQFNFEQQAQIVEDGWKLNSDFSWTTNAAVLGVYDYFLKQVSQKESDAEDYVIE